MGPSGSLRWGARLSGCKAGGGTGAPAGGGIVTSAPGAASAASNRREVKGMSEKVRQDPSLLLPSTIIRPMVARMHPIPHLPFGHHGSQGRSSNSSLAALGGPRQVVDRRALKS
jgi:hypothetical protein